MNDRDMLEELLGIIFASEDDKLSTSEVSPHDWRCVDCINFGDGHKWIQPISPLRFQLIHVVVMLVGCTRQLHIEPSISQERTNI